jgi:hypothetical protein
MEPRGDDRRLPEGRATFRRDPRTGEIVLRWYYYCPVTEEDVWFSKRFHPRDYVSEKELRTTYRLTTTQRNALGSYQECASWIDAHGHEHITYWWKRECVEAVVTMQPGYQPGLF